MMLSFQLPNIPEPTSFWPTSYVALLSAILSTVTAIGLLWAAFKHINRLNGYGIRLNEFIKESTEKMAKLEGSMTRLDLAVDRTLQAQTFLLQQIGEAKQAATNCRDEMREYTISVGSKVDEMRKAFESYREEHDKKTALLLQELRIKKVIGD